MIINGKRWQNGKIFNLFEVVLFYVLLLILKSINMLLTKKMYMI